MFKLSLFIAGAMQCRRALAGKKLGAIKQTLNAGSRWKKVSASLLSNVEWVYFTSGLLLRLCGVNLAINKLWNSRLVCIANMFAKLCV